MRHVYESRAKDLEKYLETFKYVPHQRGLYVIINAETVGQGTDHRFEGKAILGSALLYRKKVIHMAFFKDAQSSKTGRMSSYSRRREFRV